MELTRRRDFIPLCALPFALSRPAPAARVQRFVMLRPLIILLEAQGVDKFLSVGSDYQKVGRCFDIADADGSTRRNHGHVARVKQALQ